MSGNINFNGWLNDDGSENYKCRAWVNFNGTGTVAIRASGGVSSITDNGVGDYTVNFTTAMPDADYIFTGGQTVVGGNINGPYYNQGETKTTTAFRVRTYSYVSSGADNSDAYISIFR